MVHKYVKYSHYLMFYLQLLFIELKVNYKLFVNPYAKTNRIYFILFRYNKLQKNEPIYCYRIRLHRRRRV